MVRNLATNELGHRGVSERWESRVVGAVQGQRWLAVVAKLGETSTQELLIDVAIEAYVDEHVEPVSSPRQSRRTDQ
jgi:hypothetical protein